MFWVCGRLFGLPCISFVNVNQFVRVSFSFGLEGEVRDSIVEFPDRCLSFLLYKTVAVERIKVLLSFKTVSIYLLIFLHFRFLFY